MIKRNDNNYIAKDEARTPPELFRKLDKEFHFALDLCCTRENCLCGSGIFKGTTDSFVVDWNRCIELSAIAAAGDKKSGFCNPPYSSGPSGCILDWVHKAYLESGKGATVVMLIPSDPSTQYFDFCFHNAQEIRFLIPRVRFNNPDGIPMKGSPTTGSMVVVFGPDKTPCKVPCRFSIWKWKESK